jgi:serine phosphatase RsbU (regulator of sigma subunit)
MSTSNCMADHTPVFICPRVQTVEGKMTRKMRCSRSLALIAVTILIAFALCGHSRAQSSPESTVTNIDGLGKGYVELGGPWQFHLGDDPRWAEPEIDDRAGQGGWETIRADRPWGAQGHYAQTGYGWYRLRLHVQPAPGFQGSIQVLLQGVSDACAVYWNGALVGTYGSLPPRASWPALNAPSVFTLSGKLTGDLDGVLAIRVWKGPLGSSAFGEIGGLLQAPLIGDAQSISAYIGTWNFNFLEATLYNNTLNVLYFAVAFAGFLLWLRRRGETLLLWFSIFAITPAIWTSIFTMRIPVSSQFVEFFLQPLWQLRNVALWFLLLDLLSLRSRHGLVRWTKILAAVSLSAAFLDGCLVYGPQSISSTQAGAWIDGFFTLLIEPCDLWLLVLVAFGFRQKLDSVRWTLAVTSTLSQLLTVASASARQGQRFTHWTLAAAINKPIFHIAAFYFTAQTLLDLLLYLSIVYAVYRVVSDQQRRKATLEQELQSARELQQVLIPEKPPTLPGFTISTAYQPALDVGGDFFQVIPLESSAPGSTLIVLGDVSGKGLRAAMAVSLIVGAVRALAEATSSPAEILAGLSRRLHGRLQGGFTTCIVLRLDPHGACTIACAGHPSPLLNGREIDLPGALPLGIDPSIAYQEVQLQIEPDDRFALYTDGLLEARAPTGEIFSFERLQSLFASHADAARATAEAVAFGQEDDITVLTLTRSATA